MKRILSALILVLLLLCGCSDSDKLMDRALLLRESVLSAKACTFTADISVDYQDAYYTFKLHCKADADGNLIFEVVEPETIYGITGIISYEGGRLTFDDQVLAFPTLAEGQITPVCAPWILLKTLRSGYISACSDLENGMLIKMHDSYADDALQLDIRTDGNDIPVSAEIFWKGRRAATILVEDFHIL